QLDIEAGTDAPLDREKAVLPQTQGAEDQKRDLIGRLAVGIGLFDDGDHDLGFIPDLKIPIRQFLLSQSSGRGRKCKTDQESDGAKTSVNEVQFFVSSLLIDC